VNTGFTGLSARLETSTLLLSGGRSSVGGLARTAVGWCEPFFRLPLPAPVPSARVRPDRCAHLPISRCGERRLDPACSADPSAPCSTRCSPLRAFEQIAQQIATVAIGIPTVQAILDAIDLRSLQGAVNGAGPILVGARTTRPAHQRSRKRQSRQARTP
jgi:hypothetical protein